MSRAPKKWTSDEDRILHEQVMLTKSSGSKDWTGIAQHLPGRTNRDCRKRWCNHLVSGIHKGTWTAEEDERLVAAFQKHGQQWPAVAEAVGTRAPDQCAKRWNQALSPTLDRSRWTLEEQRKLLQLVKEHGRQWKMIQETYFPERATNNVKNRYMSLTKRESIHVDEALQQQTAENHAGNYETAESSPEPDDDTMLLLDDFMPMSTADLDLEAEGSFNSSDLDLQKLDLYPGSMDLDRLSPNDLFSMDFAFPTGCVVDAAPSAPPETTIRTAQPTQTQHQQQRPDVLGLHEATSPESSNSSLRFVLKIDDPSSDVVRDVMGKLIESKTKFKAEMVHDGT